jgi:ferric-dicitrate binding protein FerR (iron transport regulator)
MQEHDYHKIEDFLLDNSFVQWALGNAPEQHDYWQHVIAKNPDCVEAYNIIKSIRIKSEGDLSDQDVEAIIAHVSKQITGEQADNSPRIKFRITNLARIAAIFILAVTVILGYVVFNGKGGKSQGGGENNLETDQNVWNKSSKPMLVKLPDQSLVILQPGAQLIYPSIFNAHKREVRLKGEAFFEVSKNAARPFYVLSNELTIRVVGTSFKVKANAGDDQFKITVSTGRVEVSAHQLKGTQTPEKEIVVLMPNQQAVLYRKALVLQKIVLKKPLLLSEESTAIHFNFSGTPFSEVISTIEEAYGVHITYNEKVMGACQLTASLIDQPLDERLRLICKAVEAEYRIVDGQIIIEGKGCGN